MEEIATQRHQTASTLAQLAGGGSGVVVVTQRPRVPAGISDVYTEPEASALSRPMAAPVGEGPRVSSHTLRLEQAGNVTAGSAPHTTLYAGQAQPPQATPAAASPAVPSAQSKVEAIVKEALRQRDYQKASEAYAKATPEERELIIAEVVNEATAVLRNDNAALTDTSTGGSMNPQARADSAIKSVNAMVQRLDKAFAGAVADEAMEVFKQFYRSHLARMPGGSGFGRDGIKELTWLSGRIAGTSQGDLAIAGFVTMHAWDGATVAEAQSKGAGDAYAIAYAAYVKTQTGDASFVPRSLAEARVALQDKLDSDMRALAEHGKEMAWVAKHVCEPLGPELAQKALDGYLASKSADWKKEDETLRGRVVESRDRLVRHMIALNKIGPGLAPSMREQWEAIAKDPVASQSILDALNDDPNLMEGDGLKDVAGLLATIQEMIQKEKRPLGQFAFFVVRTTNIVATAFLNKAVLEKLNGLKPGDPAGAVKIAEALDGLRNKWFAKILGWSEADLDQAVTLVKEAAAGYAENSRLIKVAVESRKLAKMEVSKLSAQLDALAKELDADVTAKFTDGINKLELRAFNGATTAGRMMKGLAATMGIYLFAWGSIQATISHLNVENAVRTVAMSSLASIRITDLLVSLGLFSPKGPVGRYAAAKLGNVGRLAAKLLDVPGVDRLAATLADLPAVQRLVGGKLAAKLATVPLAEVYCEIYAVLEFGRGVKAAAAGDAVQAGLSGVAAGGFVMAFAPAFGAAPWSGPVGMAIGAVAIFGQMIYDGAKDAHQYEKASEICLKAAGFNAVAAAKLSRQPPYLSLAEGAGQMPRLAQLAAFRGVPVLELVNDLTTDEATERGETVYVENPDRARRLSDILLSEMNEGRGDPTAHRDDGKWYPAQPPERQLSPEAAQRRRWNTEMRLFESALVREKILDPKKVMPDEPFWQDP